MTVITSLEEHSLRDLLLVLARNQETGQLTVEHEDDLVKVAFKNGSIICAASTGVRETVGSMLVRRGLISEDDLEAALDRQRRDHHIDLLGNILVDMGVLSPERLLEVVSLQYQTVLREGLQWSDGVARFEKMGIPAFGAIRVDPRDIIPGLETAIEGSGVESIDEYDALDGVDQTADAETPITILEDLHEMSLTLTSEMAAVLLDHVGRLVKRALLFLVYPDVSSMVGGFGFVTFRPPRTVPDRPLDLPRTDDSVISRVIEEGRVYRGPLSGEGGDSHLVDFLGGTAPAEVIAVPVSVDGLVVAVLYGDNGADGGAIGSEEQLSPVVEEVAREMAASRRGGG